VASGTVIKFPAPQGLENKRRNYNCMIVQIGSAGQVLLITITFRYKSLAMLGSKSTFFIDLTRIIESRSVLLLLCKRVFRKQVAIYIKAFDYFEAPDEYDGATLVKDLMDILGLI
jgi:hypothetical protein